MSGALVAGLSHLVGGLAFAVLTLVLLIAWRGRIQGGFLVLASGVSALWCASVTAFALLGMPPFSATQLLELLRDGAWLLFLIWVLRQARGDAETTRRLHLIAAGLLAVGAITGVLVVMNRYAPGFGRPETFAVSGPILGHVLLAVAGLALVEQIYRNTRADSRWTVKFLCFGIGGVFAYDLYLYAHALLFKSLDPGLWMARGLVNAMVVPFIAVAARRNPQWSVDVFVSRHVVFHSAAVFGAGVYLLTMAGAGYYIRVFGGSWGGVAQAVFLFGAVMVLGAVMVSSRLRAEAKVFLSKHFYRNQYDYRDEWLRFTQRLSDAEQGVDPRETITEAIANVVESPSGVMWGRDAAGRFRPVASWQAPLPAAPVIGAGDSLATFLAGSGWIVYLDEYRDSPEAYPDLELPSWPPAMGRAWVVVPLIQGEELVGFVVLARSATKRSLDWEDSDLLKTVGRQAASYIALLDATEALSESRQFEAFNRLSAYVVHDLKNVTAQLSLVASNARRHMHSPGFVEDAIDTVENATAKMSRMLNQLSKGRIMEAGAARRTSLRHALEQAVAARAVDRPVPVLAVDGELPAVEADPDRLEAVVEHLVQNAQEATPDDGEVSLRAWTEGQDVVVEVRDSGCGMDARFIRERLFRPFDTTKGNAGMGVGVYESREFVQSLGGRLEVTSDPGVGTVFELRMPCEESRGEEHGGEEQVGQEAGDEAADREMGIAS
jgi:putative PEP-CTERM system histidine kinase